MSEHEASMSCSPQCAETEQNKHKDDINAETVQNTISNNSLIEEALQSDSDRLKDLLTDTFCHVCEATLLYESQRVSHYEGKKHAQKVRLFLQSKNAERSKPSQECKSSLKGLSADPEKFCELCNMVFSSPTVAKSHYVGKVHAKNLRKTNAPPCGNSTLVLGSTAPLLPPAEVTVQKQTGPDPIDASGLGDQEVDVDDPNKYCKLCRASFNNPVVAQQHYSGKKHQRNQARQQMMDQLADQSEHASSLTCPICCMTFSSIEMYQAHMQGNKHHIKEKKVMELCQSQKKVYDSYQDELADYIQVQKARGLEPKGRPGTVGQTSKSLNEITDEESPQDEEIMPHPALMPHGPPPAVFSQSHWHPQFQSQINHFGFRMRGPVPHYLPEYMPHPHTQFTPGHLMKRRRGPDAYSSSSFSDSSSSYSSSSSSSTDSSSSYEKRRQRRKIRKQRMKRRHQEDECDTEEELKERKKKGEEERENKKEKTRRKKERSQKRHRDAHHAKRRKEEEFMVKEEEVMNVEAQGKMNECVDERTDMNDGKQKHKKDKKKGKEKVNQEDNRTEEERLWDETILGVF